MGGPVVKLFAIVAGLAGCGVINGVTGDPEEIEGPPAGDPGDAPPDEACVEPARNWSQLTSLGSPPTPRMQHLAVYDPVRQRLIVHGGMNDQRAVLADAWALSLPTGA